MEKQENKKSDTTISNMRENFPCGVIFTPTYIDIGKFDTKLFVDTLNDSNVNFLVVDVTEHAGNYAFYPSKHAPHHPLLEGRDVFGEVVTACAKHNIDVYARILFNFLDDIAAARHPEMLALNKEGQPQAWLQGNADVPGFFRPRTLTCLNSPHRRQHMSNVLTELAERYPKIKGIQSDTFWQSEICHCSYCKKKYAEEVNKPLPRERKRGDDIWQSYEKWQSRCVAEINQWFALEIKRTCSEWVYFNPIVNYFEPHDFGLSGSCDFQKFHDTAERAFLETLNWYLPNRHRPHIQGIEDLRYLSTLGKKTFVFNEFTCRSPMGLWNAVASPPNELKLSLAQIVANGGMPMCWLEVDPNAYDNSMFKSLSDFYSEIQAHSKWYLNRKLAGDIALYASVDTQHVCAIGSPKREYSPSFHGAYSALIQEHGQFHLLTELHSESSICDLSRYKMIVLPQAASMSDECVGNLKEYVRQGGVIFATGQTSLYNSDGSIRDNFALAEVFGADFNGTVQKFPEEKKQEFGANIVGGFTMNIIASEGPTREVEQGRQLPYDEYVNIKSRDCARVLAKVCLPIWPYGSWPASNSIYTEHPAIIVNKFGKGICVYVPGRVFHAFETYGYPIFRSLLRGAIQTYIAEPLVKTDAPAGVEINSFEHPQGLVVDLVNTCGQQGRPFGDIVPVYDIELKIKIPSEWKTPAVTALWSEETLQATREGSYVRCVLKKLSVYETLVLSKL